MENIGGREGRGKVRGRSKKASIKTFSERNKVKGCPQENFGIMQ